MSLSFSNDIHYRDATLYFLIYMQDVTLLKTQKNEVFEMILKVSLQPNDFSWTTDEEVTGLNRHPTVFFLPKPSSWIFLQIS